MVLPMVLWVLCIKSVGLTLSSPCCTMSSSIFSEFSKQPKLVAVIIASGTAIPASSKANIEVSTARRIKPLMRRSSMGFTKRLISNGSAMSAILTRDLVQMVRQFAIDCSPICCTLLGKEKSSEVSLPPNPNELHNTCCNERALFAAKGTIPSGISVCHPMFIGANSCCIASRQITVSMLPDALVVCPVKPFVLEIKG